MYHYSYSDIPLFKYFLFNIRIQPLSIPYCLTKYYVFISINTNFYLSYYFMIFDLVMH